MTKKFLTNSEIAGRIDKIYASDEQLEEYTKKVEERRRRQREYQREYRKRRSRKPGQAET